MDKVAELRRQAVQARRIADELAAQAQQAAALERIAVGGFDTAVPSEIAPILGTTVQGLAMMRFRGTGPKFMKCGRKVLYRWSDVRDYLDANTREPGTGRG